MSGDGAFSPLAASVFVDDDVGAFRLSFCVESSAVVAVDDAD